MIAMTREQKIEKRKERAKRRRIKNKNRQKPKKPLGWGNGLDCPFDVDMNGRYGTCNCDHRNYEVCLGDI